jgi:hypothetical protein
MVGHPEQRPRHRGVGLNLLQTFTRLVVVRHPNTTHQLGLADIQRRDPRDDLLVVFGCDQHRGLLPAARQMVAAARRNHRVAMSTLRGPSVTELFGPVCGQVGCRC